LAQWHRAHGFADPTKSARVRDVLRGIQAEHPQPVRQAEALVVQDLEACISSLEQALLSSEAGVQLRAARDRALLLLGFWRAFRGDELCQLRVEYIRLKPDEGLELFLPSSKSDRANRGRSLTVPALKRLCPVQAYQYWVGLSGLTHGPVFRGIDRWGNLGEAALNPNSLSRLLRSIFRRSTGAGQQYSAHSLRRGFATWASRSHWSSKALMEYVGWRDVQSAARYIEADYPFGAWRR